MTKKSKRLLSVLLSVFLMLQLFPAIPSFAENIGLSYVFANDIAGNAEGTLTVTGAAGVTSGYYHLYFADANGVLEDYEPIAVTPITSGGTAVTLPRAMFLPPQATSIVVFKSATATLSDTSLSSAVGSYNIPSEKRLPQRAANMTFASVSDAHLNYDDNGFGASAKWTAALNFFAEKGMDYVILSGDITSAGYDYEYERYKKATAASDFPASHIYEAQGNHDAAQVARFLSYTSGEGENHPFDGSAWFSVLMESEAGKRDNLFIFMAQELPSTSSTPTTDNFSAKQLDWVEGLLKKYAGTDTNIFLVEHAMIRNFGPGDRYNGVYVEPMYFNDNFPGNMRLKSILTEYKEIIMMSGHTHLSFYDGYNYGDENGAAARMIHNSSTSQPRCYTDYGAISYNSEGKTTATAGSEGYLVYVYDDNVTYVGYNLTTGEAIPKASYVIPLYSEDRNAAVSIKVTAPPTVTEYESGAWFDGSGMVVTASYPDGSKAEVKGWGCSKVGALTSKDKEVLITYGNCEPVSVTINVSSEPSINGEDVFEGSGTYDDPFLISNADDFMALTKIFNACTTAKPIAGSGCFYRQTADIDMTDYKGYAGTDANGTAKCYFGGLYDGNGHTLTVNITSGDQRSVFPYIYGAIYNLKIHGSITSDNSAQPIRTIQSGAIVANCEFDLKLSAINASGVCYTNYSTIYNVYTHGIGTNAIATTNNGKYYNVFHYMKNSSGNLHSAVSATAASDPDTVVKAFNDRESASAKNGIEAFKKLNSELSEECLLNAYVGVSGIDFGQSTVYTSGVKLDKSEIELKEGESAALTATVEPEDATDKTVTWKSSDENVLTVNDGSITALKAGKATVTVTTVDGGFTAECAVTVREAVIPNEPTPKYIAVTKYPDKTEYAKGAEFDPIGMELTVFYDNTYKIVTTGFETEYDFSITGQAKVTVKYGGITTSIIVTVTDRNISSIAVIKNPDKTQYLKDSAFNPSGMILALLYANGSYEEITSGFTCEYGFNTSGWNTVIINYAGKTASLRVFVINADINTDGTVTASDLAALKKYLFGITDDNFDLKAADINSDGKINILDLIYLKKLLLEA